MISDCVSPVDRPSKVVIPTFEDFVKISIGQKKKKNLYGKQPYERPVTAEGYAKRDLKIKKKNTFSNVPISFFCFFFFYVSQYPR